MDDVARAELEERVRRLCTSGDHDAAATAALKSYGREIFGFLLAMQRNEDTASEIFSIFSENLWKGLPGFAWECPLRAWMYTIARNTAYRYGKQERRHVAGRALAAGSGSAIGEIAAQVRTETRSWMKTEQKDRFASLRATLPEEDQTLLILRVDRGLAWEDLARIMLGEEGAADPEAIKKESARLRKRFQLVKEKLVTLGKKAGLIKPKE